MIGVEPADLETIWKLRMSPVHVPLTDKTRGLIAEREIGIMKPTTMLVNCPAGHHGRSCSGCCCVIRRLAVRLSVFTEEPPKDSPFVLLKMT